MIIESSIIFKKGSASMQNFNLKSNHVVYFTIGVLMLLLNLFALVSSFSNTDRDTNTASIYDSFFLEVPEMYQSNQ